MRSITPFLLLAILATACTSLSATATVSDQPPPCDTIGQTWVSPMDGMTLVCVPAGEFIQGSAADDLHTEPNEEPQHVVHVDAFWIDRTEATNAMFAECVAANACHERTISPYLWGVFLPNGDPYYYESEYHDYPVIMLDGDEAQAYCRWAGRRLPYESEWEKAARGSDDRLYPWGAGIDCEQANFLGCTDAPARVDAYPESVSPYGALNMAGNVWEWVADWYSADYYVQAPTQNPHGPETGLYRTLRGGGWRSLTYQLRVTNRASGKPEHATDGEIGIRCALDEVLSP